MTPSSDDGRIDVRARVRQAAVGAIDRTLGAVATPLLLNHSRLAARQGLSGLTVVLSFDCDTDADIDVVGDVHERLGRLGVLPAYAVPGGLLQRGEHAYAALARGGAEFVNHGFHEHCTLEPVTRTYVSSYFYDTLGPSEVEGDVRAGHEAVTALVGVAPVGFRTPHFGSYQRRAHLRHLYRILGTLGYRYSSSTSPLRGLVRGPLAPTGTGLVELAVSGRRDRPRRVLDSWSFRFAPGRDVEPADYGRQVRSLLSFFRGRSGLLNLYADPSQVVDWPEFFEVMADLAPHAAPSFRAVLDRVA